MRIRDIATKALGPALLLVAGVVLMALSDGDRGAYMSGWIASALGAIWLTLLFFYEVGRSEDREREREQRRRR